MDIKEALLVIKEFECYMKVMKPNIRTSVFKQLLKWEILKTVICKALFALMSFKLIQEVKVGHIKWLLPLLK